MEYAAGILELIITNLPIALAIVFAFGMVILFHEFGHFMVAKFCGVECPDFSLGMGPEIAGVNWRGTRYKLCILPIGGYVRMVGESEDEELESAVPPERNFRFKSPLQKIAIVFAGPFMNFVLAVLIFTSISMIWGIPRELPDLPKSAFHYVKIDIADPRKPAARAGIKKDDTILYVNGREVHSPEDFTGIVYPSAGRPLLIRVKRGQEIKDIVVTPRSARWEKKKRGEIGVVLGYILPRTIEKVTPDSPAYKAGLGNGDIILAFDKYSFDGNNYFLPSGETELSVYKNGNTENITIHGEKGTSLGAELLPLVKKPGIFNAVYAGTGYCFNIIRTTGIFLVGMIRMEVPTDDVAGPVGIVQYAAAFFHEGLKDFLEFFAVISVSIAVLNLMPIPALDGSRILFTLWEAVIRRPLDPKKESLIHYIGFCFLIALIVLISYRDIRKMFGL